VPRETAGGEEGLIWTIFPGGGRDVEEEERRVDEEESVFRIDWGGRLGDSFWVKTSD
jgi:hypothetical protein